MFKANGTFGLLQYYSTGNRFSFTFTDFIVITGLDGNTLLLQVFFLFEHFYLIFPARIEPFILPQKTPILWGNHITSKRPQFSVSKFSQRVLSTRLPVNVKWQNICYRFYGPSVYSLRDSMNERRAHTKCKQKCLLLKWWSSSDVKCEWKTIEFYLIFDTEFIPFI